MGLLWTIDGRQLTGAVLNLFKANPDDNRDTALRDSVIIALFTDKRAPDGDPLPVENGDRRGWWADALSALNDALGSLLWTLERSLVNNETATLARGFAEDALEYLTRDRIATEVLVEGSVVRFAGLRPNAIQLDVTIRRGDAPDIALRFQGLWEGTPSA